EILIFSKGTVANGSNRKMRYYPQGLRRVNKKVQNRKTEGVHGLRKTTLEKYNENGGGYVQEYENYPKDVLRFASEKNGFHPTQKPVNLIEYLIKTYTKEGELVLDSCMGSFT